MSRKLTFTGESSHKVDAKGRVSIPASFRRVLAAGDPDWQDGANPQVAVVYGDDKRNYLECFTVAGLEAIHAKIKRLPQADKRRRAMFRLYSTQTQIISVDETGRLVLSAKLRAKIGLTDAALFASMGETFEIWRPETYEAAMAADLEADDDFDPDLDASHYLDGDEGF